MIFYDRGEYREDRLSLAVDGPAFRYGFGFFETLFWDGAGVCRLDLHLKRLGSSLSAFGLPFAPGDLSQAVETVARRNGLAGSTARVNIIVPVDGPGPYRPVVTALAYAPPPMERPLSLALSPRPLHAWLGAFKTNNYLHFHLEHRAAQDAGLDGVAITAPGGWLLEAAHATLVFAKDGKLFTPAPPCAPHTACGPPPLDDGGQAAPGDMRQTFDLAHEEDACEGQSDAYSPESLDETAPGLLPGTALAAAREALDIEARPIHLDELKGFDHAWALNSLMGMRCVDRIGDVSFVTDGSPIAAAEDRIRSR